MVHLIESHHLNRRAFGSAGSVFSGVVSGVEIIAWWETAASRLAKALGFHSALYTWAMARSTTVARPVATSAL